MHIDRLVNGWWKATWWEYDLDKGYIDTHQVFETRAETAAFMWYFQGVGDQC